jgi:hypothetical protein
MDETIFRRSAMRCIMKRITLLAAALMMVSVPVLAEEGTTMGSMFDKGQQPVKNECLLVAKNCTSDSVQERINRIENEIKRGTDVYSADEIKQLHRELEENNRLLRFEENESNPGAGV